MLVGTGTGQPVNGAIPSLPSPTMPNFNMAAQTPNGQPAGSDPGVYTNGIPQTYPGREYQLRRSVPPLRNARPIDAGLYYFAFAMRSGVTSPRWCPQTLLTRLFYLLFFPPLATWKNLSRFSPPPSPPLFSFSSRRGGEEEVWVGGGYSIDL